MSCEFRHGLYGSEEASFARFHNLLFFLTLFQVSDIGLALGRKSTSGLGKAVEVLDNLSSSMSSLSPGGAFVSAPTTKGNKISILAFEVANTIVKGMSLMQSLSKESLKYLKDTVLMSEGVQRLVSSNMDDLMRIAAADKRSADRCINILILCYDLDVADFHVPNE